MKNGFTLIELLVVVLIIGILAAISLPAYSDSVKISRIKPMLPLLRGLSDAQKRYYLVNDGWAQSFDDLDISMPPGTATDNGSNVYYKITNSQAGITLYKSNGAFQLKGLAVPVNIEQTRTRELLCCADDSRKKYCFAMGFDTPSGTFTGDGGGCTWYKMKN